MIEVKIPSPGESVNEVEIANWLVEQGEYVEKDQEIAEIESDKATLPLVAEGSGTIEILAPEGETVKVGAVACRIDTTALAPQASQGSKTSKAPSNHTPGQPESGSPAGEKAAEPSDQITTEKNEDSTDAPQYSASEKPKAKVSPLARRMMDDHNLSLDDVLEGLRRITKEDVSLAIEGLKAGNQQDASYPEPQGHRPGVASREENREKISKLRKKLSERLVSVKNETAMLTTFNEIDMSQVMAIRKRNQKAFQEKHGIKLGLMSFFIKASALALKAHPNVNSMIDGEEIVYPRYADIGIAVQTPKGLMVPVIRNAENLSLAELERQVKNFGEKGQHNRIRIDEMQGGTFSITNGGVFGSLLSTPIINPPQSAILGMHTIQERPVAIEGKMEIRPMMYIALSYDHRTIDGKDSVSFLMKIKELVEHPKNMLLPGGSPEKQLLEL